MPRRAEDAIVWVGYADFLTTLAMLFFVLVVGLAARAGHSGTGVVNGRVSDASTHTALQNCVVHVGASRSDTTTKDGVYRIEFDSLQMAVTTGIRVNCDGYGEYSDLVVVQPNDSSERNVSLAKANVVSVVTLSGDALFAPNEYWLKPEGIQVVSVLGRRIRQGLGSDELIAVQGHTDDIAFPAGSGKDNWTLSGERAASAAQVLIDSAGISPCQISTMGFGPSRPVAPVLPSDTRADRNLKRARNRRIEFRKLRGAELTGSGCHR